MDLNLQKYQAFLKTAELGSFTKAAIALNCSQSGVSRMIHDLETEWNVTLLERRKSGVRLTSEGLKLLPYVQSICSEQTKLENCIGELTSLSSGIIRIGTISSVATYWLPKILKKFQADYPNIEYEFLMGDYTEIEKWITEGRVDCGFTLLPTHTNLDTIPLVKDELMVILPRNHPLASSALFPVTKLADEPFILLEKGGRAEISRIFEQNRITPNIKYTIFDDYATMSMVENGFGISILPNLILQRISYDIVIKKLDVPAFRTLGFAIRDEKAVPLAVKKFMEYLKYR